MNTASALLSAPSSHSVLDDDDVLDDSCLDGCSICLEPFTSLDPPSVTKCMHEYHLHCILEWSQRRIECPICLQHLVLNNPVSQELLAAVESEKNLSSRRTINPTNQGNENSPLVNECDNEQPIMLHFAAIASRARNFTRRRGQMTPAAGPSQILPSVPVANTSNLTQINSSSSEHQNIASCFSDADSATSVREASQSPSHIPGKSSSSEFVAFSESLKSKISTASIRYKESISKSTHSLKEKLIARNDSVKELSRGVQREMSAGIAGIARMIAQKRGGVSAPSSTSSSCTMETSNSRRGLIEDDTIVQSFWPSRGETSKEMSSDSTPLFTNSNSGGLGVSLAKEKN